jgi:hypothetical protein
MLHIEADGGVEYQCSTSEVVAERMGWIHRQIDLAAPESKEFFTGFRDKTFICILISDHG